MPVVDTTAVAVDTVPSAPVPGPTDTPPTDTQSDPTPADKAATPSGDPDLSDTKVVKKPWYQKKLAEQAYELREARRLNERLLGLIESNRQTEKRTGEEAPKPENFSSLNEYIDAAVEYKLKSQKPPEPKSQPQSNPEIHVELEGLMAEGLEKYEDFQELIESDGLRITPVMRDAILEADGRAEVAYFLGKNPKEAARIARLTPVRQIAEIARIEDKLNVKPVPPKKPSNAPAPVTPVSGTSAQDNGLSDSDDIKTWMKKRNKLVRPG